MNYIKDNHLFGQIKIMNQTILLIQMKAASGKKVLGIFICIVLNNYSSKKLFYPSKFCYEIDYFNIMLSYLNRKPNKVIENNKFCEEEKRRKPKH